MVVKRDISVGMVPLSVGGVESGLWKMILSPVKVPSHRLLPYIALLHNVSPEHGLATEKNIHKHAERLRATCLPARIWCGAAGGDRHPLCRHTTELPKIE